MLAFWGPQKAVGLLGKRSGSESPTVRFSHKGKVLVGHREKTRDPDFKVGDFCGAKVLRSMLRRE
jgi:hypothetical protein